MLTVPGNVFFFMRAFDPFLDKRAVALQESNIPHCLVATEGNTKLEKTTLSQYFLCMQ